MFSPNLRRITAFMIAGLVASMVFTTVLLPVHAEDETGSTESYATGGMDESTPVPSTEGAGSGFRLRSRSSLPTAYDSRNVNGKNYVTSIKNQNPLNICWSYATIAAIESSILAHGQASSPSAVDLSERQLAFFSYNLVPDSLGNTTGDKNTALRTNYIDNYGNAWLTTEVLASGIGVVNESKAPVQFLIDEWIKDGRQYSQDFKNRTNLSPELARGANSWVLSSAKRISMLDRDVVKRAIMENGGVAVLTYLKTDSSDISWNKDNAAYYNYKNGKSNHLVTIVGWDDDYPITNFSEVYRPHNPGAWLVKNSYGGRWGKEGFCWVSYDDFYFNKTDPENLEKGSVAAYAYEMRPASESECLYQYDGTAGTCYKTMKSGDSIANMYTVNADKKQGEKLDSVCLTLLNDADVNYSIQVYTDCTDESNPTSGKAAFSTPQTGKTDAAGFYTIPLDVKVPLKSGSKYAVVATLSHEGQGKVQYDVDSYGKYHEMARYESKANKNQSFVKDAKTGRWSDLSELTCDCDLGKDRGHEDGKYHNCVARVKAITKKHLHNWDNGKVTKAPTADETGIKTFTCTICGVSRTESIAKLGSNPNQKGEGGSAIGKGASAEVANIAITTSSKEEGPAGSKYYLLQLKSTKQTNTSVRLEWKKVKGAKRYVVYGNVCGSKNKMKKLGAVTSTSKSYSKIAGKKVKKGTYYKFIVVALNSKNNVITTSKVIHVASKGGKVGNNKSVTIKAKVNAKGKAIKTYKVLTNTVIKKGKAITIKASATPVSKKLKVKRHRKISFESSNPKVAKVSTKGRITAKSKGTCYIYAYAQNGVMKRIKIKVK